MTRDDSVSTGPRVRREHRHLDLVLESPGYRPLVVENKAFALPDRSQLDGYGKSVLELAGDGREATAVLLSLIAPAWREAYVTVEGQRSVT